MLNFVATFNARLDAAVANALKISRNQAQILIKDALVSVNGKTTAKPALGINLGDEILVNFKEAPQKPSEYEVNFDVPVIYEDDDLLVLNKPPQIVVHGAPSVKEATLVEWLNERGIMLSSLNGQTRAGIVHRLDKGTSGAIVVAKNNASHAALSAQLSDKSMGRIYLALTDLALKEDCIIDAPIGRSVSNRLKKAVAANGREAKSAFINLVSNGEAGEISRNLGVNLISAKLFTGRTHQIRAHLASINRHILGDNLYGFKSQNDKISRVMLHAYLMYFIHPRTKQRMEFTAPIWSDFKEILNAKIPKETIDEKTSPNYLNAAFSRLCSGLRR